MLRVALQELVFLARLARVGTFANHGCDRAHETLRLASPAHRQRSGPRRSCAETSGSLVVTSSPFNGIGYCVVWRNQPRLSVGCCSPSAVAPRHWMAEPMGSAHVAVVPIPLVCRLPATGQPVAGIGANVTKVTLRPAFIKSGHRAVPGSCPDRPCWRGSGCGPVAGSRPGCPGTIRYGPPGGRARRRRMQRRTSGRLR